MVVGLVQAIERGCLNHVWVCMWVLRILEKEMFRTIIKRVLERSKYSGVASDSVPLRGKHEG
jgi:hypothetical protein